MANDVAAPPKKVVLLKMPSFTRMLIGGLAAFWLASVMNPAFAAIAVLIIFFIPVLTVDNIFSRQFERAYKKPEEVQPKKMSKAEYLAALEEKGKASAKEKEKAKTPANDSKNKKAKKR